MKKLYIVLAIVALLVTTAQAQMTKNPGDTKGGSDRVVKRELSKLYGSMVSYTQNNQEIVKIEFDEIIVRICQDKKITKAVEEISKYRFSSRDEALNILSSHGWMVDQVWTTEGRNGVTVNYILSKQVPALTPISPWLEKRAEKDGAGKDAGKASGGKKK